MQKHERNSKFQLNLPDALVAIGLCFSLMFSPSAQATLVGDSVNTSLISPNGFVGDTTPISLTDPVVVGLGNELQAGDGTQIGATWMLPGEFIDFQASAISLRVACGSSSTGPCMTGYGSGAKYVFGGLDDSVGTITGVSLINSGFSNFSAAWISLVDAHTISVALDTMEFTDRGQGASNNFGLLTINLTVSRDAPPDNRVPEPAVPALFALAGLALAITRRQRKL